MTQVDEPKEVHVTRHNEGFSVVYSSGQRALRSTFDEHQDAVDAVDDWNKVGDFQMKLSPEVIDNRYDVDEERAKMGLKPLAEDRDGEYFVEQIMALKALGSPTGKVLNDISQLDLDGSDAKQILRLASEGLKFAGPEDVFFETLKAISDAGNGRSDFNGRDARQLLSICQEGVDQRGAAVPALR